jgi:predicted SAM-dependent methyltransferase
VKLNVGCGVKKLEGYVNLDKRASVEPDVTWDIENVPWGCAHEECEEILMSHVVEHIKPWSIFDVIDEAWRVLQPNGRLKIITPTAGTYHWYIDPTHVCPWNEFTVNYFLPDQPAYENYKPKPWKLIKQYKDEYAYLHIELAKG